jgi:hypothetical protein
MKKVISFLALAFVVSAQVPNYKGFADTAIFAKFGKDTLFVSKPFYLANPDNSANLILVYDDTGYAARKNDSMLCEIGYQLGSSVMDLSGTRDTVWTATKMIDTVDGTTPTGRGKMFDPKVNKTLQYTPGAIDTSIGTSYSAQWSIFTPGEGPLIKFVAHGLEGTHHASTVKAEFIFIQKAFSYTRTN